MCGISGLVTDGMPQEAALAAVQRMNDSQRHRGPDGHGTWVGAGACLGHRRLAIIDLTEAGAQPMSNEDGSLHLVCNGEIYNYQELRRGLVGRGHEFKSHTDVESILHLYEEHGDNCVKYLVGMFAFALWDARRRRLLLARDRVGEKPLYYASTGGGIAFASELAALLTLPSVERALDDDAIACSLVYPSSPAPLTMYKGIRALPPASRLTWCASRIGIERYWQIDCSTAPTILNEREAAQELDGLLSDAVRGALIADVPVGVLLSGGVDSSAIAVHATRLGARISGYSVGCESPNRPDPDLQRARLVATRLGMPHKQIPFASVDLRLLPSIIARYGQPFNVFPMLYADQLASGVRRHVPVALGGNGADEAFGGYRGYNRQLAFGQTAAVAGLLPAQRMLSRFSGRLERLLRTAESPMIERRGRLFDTLAMQLARALCTAEFIKRSSGTNPGRFVTEYSRECNPREYLDAVMYSDLMVYHQHGTTVITDVSGMSHSLEIRAPFLDHRILEFAFRLPRHLRVRSALRPRRNKYILKKALERDLPREVLYGRKFGFGYSITLPELINGPWRRVVEAFVRRGQYLDLQIFSRQGVDWAIANAPNEVWRLLVFSVWAEMNIGGESADKISERMSAAMGRANDQRVA